MIQKNLNQNITLTVIVMLCGYIFALFTFFPFPLPAQSSSNQVELNEDSRLSDYLAYAALNNAGLKAAFYRWKAALERIPQVRSLPDPRFNFAYFIREVETRVGPQRQKVGIMQMFPWFGKLKLKGKAAVESANAHQQEYERVKLNLFYRVKDTYYEHYYITRAIDILKKNMKLLEYLEGVIDMKYRTGKAAHADLIKVQVEADKLNDRLKSMKDMLRPISVKFNLLLNKPADAHLPVPGKIQVVKPSLSYEQLQEWVKQSNPGLKALAHLVSREEFGIKLATKNYLPDFSLGVDYILTDPSAMPGTADSGKDPLAAMMSISLPIHIKKYRAGVKEARARLQAVLKQKEEEENNLLSRLDMIYYNLHDAERKVSLYQDTLIPKAKQALAVIQSAFEAGKAGSLDLIDSQRTLLSFELDYERVLTTLHQRLAELEMLLGGAAPKAKKEISK